MIPGTSGSGVLAAVLCVAVLVSAVSCMPPDFLWGQGQKRTDALESPKLTKSDIETLTLAACQLCQTFGLSQQEAVECEMGPSAVRTACFKKIFRTATGEGGAYGP